MAIRVGIVGGSVAGSVAARAFEAIGAKVQWFDPCPRQAVGALYLWTNAVNALARVGLAAPVVTAGTVQDSMEFRSWEGELLWALPVAELGTEHGAPSVLIDRKQLLAAMSASTPTAKTLWRVCQHDDSVELLFRDGETTRVDLLVAADGRDSTVRDQLFGRGAWRSTRQHLAFGYTAHTPAHSELERPGLSFITLGLDCRAWIARLNDGRSYWGAALSETRYRELASLPITTALRQAFAGAHPPIPQLFARVEGGVGWMEIEDQPVRGSWTAGRVALIGDAAHVMTPDLGQGACMGIEDAISLAAAVEGHGPARGPATWERTRRARVARITGLSHAVARAASPGGVGASRVRDWVIRGLMPPFSLHEMDRILCYRAPIP